MQLGGGANEHQALMAGKYTKANDVSSGMPYWMSEGWNWPLSALWFKEGRWRIGKKSDLGTTEAGLQSTNSPPCPESVGSNWKYYDGEEWMDALGNAKMYSKYDSTVHKGYK